MVSHVDHLGGAGRFGSAYHVLEPRKKSSNPLSRRVVGNDAAREIRLVVHGRALEPDKGFQHLVVDCIGLERAVRPASAVPRVLELELNVLAQHQLICDDHERDTARAVKVRPVLRAVLHFQRAQRCIHACISVRANAIPVPAALNDDLSAHGLVPGRRRRLKAKCRVRRHRHRSEEFAPVAGDQVVHVRHRKIERPVGGALQLEGGIPVADESRGERPGYETVAGKRLYLGRRLSRRLYTHKTVDRRAAAP